MRLWAAVRRLFRRDKPAPFPAPLPQPPLRAYAPVVPVAGPLQSPPADADESFSVTFVATGSERHQSLPARPVTVTQGRSPARVVAVESGEMNEIDAFTTAEGGINRVVLGFEDSTELAVDDRSPLSRQLVKLADRMMTRGRRWYNVFGGTK